MIIYKLYTHFEYEKIDCYRLDILLFGLILIFRKEVSLEYVRFVERYHK
jgi:hypothetical protein